MKIQGREWVTRSVVFFASVFFGGIVLLLSIFLFQKKSVGAPSDFFVQKNDQSYTLTYKNPSFSVKLPTQLSVHSDNAPADFFTSERTCRLTVEKISLSRWQTLEAWLATDTEQLKGVSVIKRSVQFLDQTKQRAWYHLETAETGSSESYYEKREQEIFALHAFTETNGEDCKKLLVEAQKTIR